MSPTTSIKEKLEILMVPYNL